MFSELAYLPIIYVGDADPYGAEIYFHYAFGNLV